jgi:hypothetical protein
MQRLKNHVSHAANLSPLAPVHKGIVVDGVFVVDSAGLHHFLLNKIKSSIVDKKLKISYKYFQL